MPSMTPTGLMDLVKQLHRARDDGAFHVIPGLVHRLFLHLTRLGAVNRVTAFRRGQVAYWVRSHGDVRELMTIDDRLPEPPLPTPLRLPIYTRSHN